jgi:acyl-homoserine-lactone acylase
MPVLVLLLLLLVTPAAGAEAEVTVYRDTWGVPHVYGPSQDAAAYGLGWAQAEDRLVDLLTAYRMAAGRLAAVAGEKAVESDLAARTARHAAVARRRYGELNEQTRRLVESFVAGIRDYMEAHPDAVPSWGEPPEPQDVVALYRAFAYVWPLGQARGDLERAAEPAVAERGSNQWVVGASRSAEGGPIMLIDPHLSWEPPNRFYEAHVHGGGLDTFGFHVVGTPIMALGHTDVLAWGLTTGGPDCADVYEERLHPDEPQRYEYDGAWRPIEVEEVDIEVRTEQGQRIERRRIERTHHGAILRRDGSRAFAMRTAYDDEIGIVEQWLGMARSRNLGEFLEALAANQALPQNLLYADVGGNIYYLRAGRVPVRPPGFEWDRPLPGWTSRSEWRGIHPLPDLVQMLNPPGGIVQNCNVAPGAMVPGFVLDRARYPAHVYNVATDRTNSRGRRVLELLQARDSLDLDGALAIAMDTAVEGAERRKAALRAAVGASPGQLDALQPAVDLLLGWNGRTDADSRAAVLYRAWMREVRERDSGVDDGKLERGEALDEGEARALLESLRSAADEVTRLHGRIDVAWGEVHRIRRGDRSWPVGGCAEDGLGTLRSVRYGEPDERGVSYATGGQLAAMVIVLEKGAVRSYSVSPYGQSDDPRSPHYADQAEKLFGPGKLKPTWYAREELLRHVESSHRRPAAVRR